MSEGHAISDDLKQAARRLGFAEVGIVRAGAPDGIEAFRQWLSRGYAGEMTYLPDRAAAYEHPRHVLEGVRSVVMLATCYRTSEPRPAAPGCGRVSRYAWGNRDYHDVIRESLGRLADALKQLCPECRVRGVVDTAPLLERQFAQMAGLGWLGKNTLLLNRDLGSWLFLSALLTDAELQPDAPTQTDHCGTCTACLDACPTGAFAAPYVLDARRCISYLTIEQAGLADPELRRGQGDWLFGCDVCQDVCPWNHRAPQASEPAFAPREDSDPVLLAELFDLTDETFRIRFRHTPLWRAKRRGLLRSAAVVLGNRPHRAALPALAKGLRDVEPLVRAACVWALSQYRNPAADAAIEALRAKETDPLVRRELDAAPGNRLAGE